VQVNLKQRIVGSGRATRIEFWATVLSSSEELRKQRVQQMGRSFPGTPIARVVLQVAADQTSLAVRIGIWKDYENSDAEASRQELRDWICYRALIDFQEQTGKKVKMPVFTRVEEDLSWAERMRRAKTGDEGRVLIRQHEAAIATLEQSLGLQPTVGNSGSGFGYRGFSTLTPKDRSAMVKNARGIDRASGDRLHALIVDGLAMDEPWKQLHNREMHERSMPPSRAVYQNERVSVQSQRNNTGRPAAATHSSDFAERPAEWNTMGAGQKAAWTRRHNAGRLVQNVGGAPPPSRNAVANAEGKPAEWNDWGPGKKAWWTRTHGGRR